MTLDKRWKDNIHHFPGKLPSRHRETWSRGETNTSCRQFNDQWEKPTDASALQDFVRS
jgi:hypothetical protein